MTEGELQNLFSEPGLYLLEDGRLPGCTVAIMTLTDTQEVYGDIKTIHRAFLLHAGCELSPDISQWGNTHATTTLVGGPFSVQSCKAMEEQCEKFLAMEERVNETAEMLGMLQRSVKRAGYSLFAETLTMAVETLTGEEPKDQNP